MTQAVPAELPEPGSPEEVALVSAAVDELKNSKKKLVSSRIGLHPAYRATKPAPATKSPHGELFKRAISAAWLTHHQGDPITPENLNMRDAGLAPGDMAELLETELFRQALEDRGIPDSGASYLTGEQMAALIVLQDHSIRHPERKRLQMAGISWAKFQGWLQQPLFRREYRELQRRILEVATERSDAVLAQLIDDGNIRAIEYANAMTGKYDPATREAQNTVSILSMVMSVMQKHVTDEVTLLALSEEFEKLALQGGLKHMEIMDAEVVEPSAD